MSLVLIVQGAPPLAGSRHDAENVLRRNGCLSLRANDMTCGLQGIYAIAHDFEHREQRYSK